MYEEGMYHYCEYCFKPCTVFCGCPQEKRALKEERERELYNAIASDLNRLDIQLTFGGKRNE